MSAAKSTTEDPWTVRRILDWTIGFLKERGSPTPRLDAEILLAHARHCRRIQLYTQFDEPLTDEQRAVMRGLVKRRANAEPVAYLVGHREFFSLDFVVRPGVFIPRPDTEILVMAALDVLKEITAPRLLDLCTGSGCVPIAITRNHATVSGFAVELDPQVAEVTQANIVQHQLENRLTLLQGDLFAPVPDSGRFDVITSNPPYVTTGEIPELAADIRDHEPHLALDGGADGLDVIRRLVQQAPAFLKSSGWLMLELDPAQAEPTQALLEAAGFVNVGPRQDLSGQARVVSGCYSGELDAE